MSLFAFHAPAANAQSAGFESSGPLPGGGTYIMRRELLAQTTAMELWFRAPAAGENGESPGISRLAITALAASRAPHGSSLAELVNRFGGSLTISVYPDIAMVGASVPSSDAAQVLRALTAAYFSPAITTEGVQAALRDCALAAAESRFDTERVMQDALFAELFTSGPAHFAPTPSTASDFTKISQAQLRAFAQRAFRQNNAVLSLAGSVDAKLLTAVRGGNAGAPADTPFDSVVAAAPGSTTKSGSTSGIGYAWAGPPIADAKAATALDFIADYLFDPDHGTLARAIHNASAGTFVNGQFITLHDPGVLLLTVSGANTPQLRRQITDAISSVQQPMDAASFEAARKAFEYHILSQSQTPTGRADNFGWYAVEGDGAYAPGAASGEYLRAVESLDPAFVAQAARTYLQHPAIVQLISSEQKGTST
ncbi:MAG TPA: insulinase family protein [Candidatus Baltobacteraceae bacterium]|nr:insulinase family protein [Candidatus Baltobacteraceae bacterium]